MRSFLLVGLCMVAATAALPKVPISIDYHRSIGIPTATKIREAEETQGRIVGGSVAPPNAYPFVAGLIITFSNVAGTSACTASLISTNRLVTAAHCWHFAGLFVNQYVVVLGSQFLFSGGTRMVTNQVIPHPNFIPDLLTNDIAVVYLPQHVPISTTITPVNLPHTSLWENFVGEMAIAAGYGKTSDAQVGISGNAVISHVNLQIIPVLDCQRVYGSVFVQASTICTDGTGGIGVCQGDSGGPLVINRNGQFVLVGVSSFVAEPGCELGFPSAYARVTSFYSFLMQHIW